MKKFLAMFALAAALVNPVSAATQQSVDVSKLTPDQIAQINKQVADMQSQPSNISSTVRKEAEAWGELGANMGKAMVGAAREVGVAANEFGQTNLGKIVVAIVTYKVVGREILGVIVGSLMMVLGYSIVIWMLLTRQWSNVQYEYEPIFWGMIKRARIVSIRTDSDVITGKILAAGVLTLLTTAIGLNTIF